MGINNENITMIYYRCTSNIHLRRGFSRFISHSSSFISSSFIHSTPPSFSSSHSFVIQRLLQHLWAFISIVRHFPLSLFFDDRGALPPISSFFPRGLERGVTGAPSHLDRASSCGRADGRRIFNETTPPNLGAKISYRRASLIS